MSFRQILLDGTMGVDGRYYFSF